MYKINSECPICHEKKVEVVQEKKERCHHCGKNITPKSTCKNNHFLCFDCEQKELKRLIRDYCYKSNTTHPLDLTIELMKLPNIPMHGPIHHFLIPAALLTAYYNTFHSIDLKMSLDFAEKRSQSVPGAVCGHWGVCGSAIGVGIYYSIIKDVSPLSTDLWKEVGQITSNTASLISREGGPRCCKRDGFIAINEAIKQSNHYLNTDYELYGITCEFFINNQQCKNVSCDFFPTK